jgi:hypothetical protein
MEQARQQKQGMCAFRLFWERRQARDIRVTRNLGMGP